MKFKAQSIGVLLSSQVVFSIIFMGCQPVTVLAPHTSLNNSTQTDNPPPATQISPLPTAPQPICSIIIPTPGATLIPITKPNPPAGAYCESSVSYISKGGLTVTLDAMYIIACGEFYEIMIDYRLENNTIDKVIDEDRFKAYFTKGSGETQYGLFGRLAPGQTITKSYTWKAYWSNVINLIEFEADPPRAFPASDTLKWKPPTN
jgi:hypothetical protein